MRLLLLSSFALVLAVWASLGDAADPVRADMTARDDMTAWKHSGKLFVLTTPQGADLPASAMIEQFPLLVRLHGDWFDFSSASPGGDDIRFHSSSGEPLSFQVEQWDAKAGLAAIWVRIPLIRGNQQQALTMFWGNPNADSCSDGKAVFNGTNGYASVWHLGKEVSDEVGTLTSKSTGMRSVAGVIGDAKHLGGREGVFGGEQIPDYPSADASHSTEAWFRAEVPNSTIIGWGNEGGGRGSKVRMQFRSPPHVHIDSDFSDVKGETTLPLNQWLHVIHTYDREDGKIYINGKLDGAATPMLDIKSPSRLWVGGWYHQYDFVGDIDEVRVSRVARSADWIKLQYANQNPLQLAVGPLVQPGSELSVAPERLVVKEGESATLVAKAGGARKLIWTHRQGENESLVAVDRLSHRFSTGRVTGDQMSTLRLTAIYEDVAKTIEVPVVVQESIADPQFTLTGPAKWDGRETVEMIASVSNLDVLKHQDASELQYEWQVSGIAAVHDTMPGKLVLRRALGSGEMRVTCTISNGGAPVTVSHEIEVEEPERDPWIDRRPLESEMPVDHQFYARGSEGVGRLHCTGTVDKLADSVFVRVIADGKAYHAERQTLKADRRYAFTASLKPGLTHYSFAFGATANGVDTILHEASDLVCGDAYVITGQSNALATDWGPEKHEYTSEWIRSFGSNRGDGNVGWGAATTRGEGVREIGCWGMELARNLVDRHQVPICIINGAVGGTLIEAHQRNDASPVDPATLYGRLLDRVQRASLNDGIRAVFWYQGENNQGAQGTTGKYGWETYEPLFVKMAADWKRDYPNIEHYYVFQIWPNACSMGGAGAKGASDKLRDVQRRLPRLFSHMTAISTLGIKPEGGCHFSPAGYIALANQVLPLVERNHYGKAIETSVTAPNLLRAKFASDQRDQVELEFDQPMQWDDRLVNQFYFDDTTAQVVSGKSAGNSITLTLKAPTKASRITYLIDRDWSSQNLLYGANGIAALTFCDEPLVTP